MKREIWSLEDISKRMSVLTGAEISTVNDFLKGIISLVPDVLKTDREVYLSEIGKFSLSEQNSEFIKFEPSKKLAESVNQFFSSFEITELDDNFPDIKDTQNTRTSETSGPEITEQSSPDVESNSLNENKQDNIMTHPKPNQGYPPQSGYPGPDPYSVPPVYPPIPTPPPTSYTQSESIGSESHPGNRFPDQNQAPFSPEESRPYYPPQREMSYDYPPYQYKHHEREERRQNKYGKEPVYADYKNRSGNSVIWIALFALSVGFMAGFFLRPVIFPWSNEPPVTIQYQESAGTENEELQSLEISESSDYIEENQNENDEAVNDEPEIITETVTRGTYLTNLARKYYGHPDFWVYIYEENKNKILDPDNVPVGTVLIIPPKEKYNIDPDSKESRTRAKNLAYEIYHR